MSRRCDSLARNRLPQVVLRDADRPLPHADPISKQAVVRRTRRLAAGDREPQIICTRGIRPE